MGPVVALARPGSRCTACVRTRFFGARSADRVGRAADAIYGSADAMGCSSDAMGNSADARLWQHHRNAGQCSALADAWWRHTLRLLSAGDNGTGRNASDAGTASWDAACGIYHGCTTGAPCVHHIGAPRVRHGCAVGPRCTSVVRKAPICAPSVHDACTTGARQVVHHRCTMVHHPRGAAQVHHRCTRCAPEASQPSLTLVTASRMISPSTATLPPH